MSEATAERSLRVCVEYEDGQYVAQCVDYDIVSFGDSPDAALTAFVRTYIKHCVVAHSLGQTLDDAPPPPDDIAARWQTQADKGELRQFTIPPFTIRKCTAESLRFPHVGAAAIITRGAA